MNTPRCNLSQVYELPDGNLVGLHLVFKLIANYLIDEMEKVNTTNCPMRFYDENTELYTLTAVSFFQPTRDVLDEKFSESGLKKCVPDGPVLITLDFDHKERQISRTLDYLYMSKREMFDLMVKKICHQSPELVQKHLVMQAQ